MTKPAKPAPKCQPPLPLAGVRTVAEGRAYVSRNYRTWPVCKEHGCELVCVEAVKAAGSATVDLCCPSYAPPTPGLGAKSWYSAQITGPKSWGSAQIPSWAPFAPTVQRGAHGAAPCAMCGGCGYVAVGAINGPIHCPTCQGTGAVRSP